MPQASTTPVIELTQVSKTYKTKAESVYALKDISIKVNEGEVVAIMGPSGSGKSTLMHIIAGLDKPTSGNVMVAKKSLKDLNDGALAGYRNQTIGFVFQFFYLQPYLDVVQNVEIPLLFAGVNPKKRHKKANEVLKTVGLEHRLGHLPNQLSGGEMQRVAIARALVNDPAIILADEPTGNLDSKTGQLILDYLLKARKERGATVVIVTHDQKVAKSADRIIAIEDGEIK